jgi:uncharacterized cysteine cluster protein YcgN (CxxCxxCC family)
VARRKTSKGDKADAPFWKRKTLEEMNVAEWESLCDGCGKCCTFTLEDEDTGDLYRTSVACQLFDDGACGCRDYSNRFATVPECLKVTPQNIAEMDFFPHTCAYVLVYEGKDLPEWHHLVCGDREEIHRRGLSVRNKTLSEKALGGADMDDFVIEWPEEQTGED